MCSILLIKYLFAEYILSVFYFFCLQVKNMQTNIKIFMFPCYKEYFLAYKVPILEMKKAFECRCARPHRTFVYVCKQHTYRCNSTNLTDKECNSKIKDPCARCWFCRLVVRLLNRCAEKNCLEEMSDSMSYRVTPIEIYLESINCDSFILFNGECVQSDLDNAWYTITASTD